MNRFFIGLSLSACLLLGSLSYASAHCQVPCGIYDDHARVHSMMEDVTTIEKAVAQISDLAGKHDAQSQNQLIRWVQTKEDHASKIITVTAEYFLTQKIKGALVTDKDYINRLVTCHRLMRAAMTAKQTVDAKVVSDLRKAVEALGVLYPAK
jgi:nickel superoxide dismutase